MVSIRVVLISINILSTISAIYASITTWSRREKAGLMATFLSLSMAFTTIYAFGYTMELASNTLSQILFWVKIEHLGIEFIGPTWLLFTLCLSGRQKMLTPGRMLGFFIIPAGMVFSVLTNLVHINPQLTANAPFPTLSYTRGPIAWIGICYIGFCLLLSLIFFTIMYLQAAPPFRKQALIFSLGSLFPLIGMIITATSSSLYNLDLAPLSMSISGIFFVFGFQHLQILDIVPLARDVIFEGMGDSVLVFDNDARLVDFNLQTKKIFSEIGDGSVGFPVNTVFGNDSLLTKLIREDSKEPIKLQKGESTYRCVMLPLHDPQKKCVGKIVTLQDYTEVENLVKQLSNLATLDYLTGIYNRRYFYELAINEIARAERMNKQLSLILFDLDDFKLINDTYGHSAGDAVLKFAVNLFIQRLRKYDIIGRFGGDEFMILLPETEITAAKTLAEELRDLLEKSNIPFEGQIFKVTACFGVASVIFQQTSPFEDLVRRADKAVYVAKDSGRNRVCIDGTKLITNSKV
ncbi:MAG: diguanylate cyclase [Anaerolineaceae bacterium]